MRVRFSLHIYSSRLHIYLDANCQKWTKPRSSDRLLAMQFIRSIGGNAQTGDPLGDMADRLRSSKATAERADPDLELPSMSHAECLAFRALSRRNGAGMGHGCV